MGQLNAQSLTWRVLHRCCLMQLLVSYPEVARCVEESILVLGPAAVEAVR